MAETLYHRIYAVVRQIPPGRVATYGQVATVVGPPVTARQVGEALAALRHAHPSPGALAAGHQCPGHSQYGTPPTAGRQSWATRISDGLSTPMLAR